MSGFLFSILSAIMVILILVAYRKVAFSHFDSSDIAKKNYFKLLSFFILWFLYLSVLSYTESLKSFEFPPRLPLLLLLPTILITTYFYSSFRNSEMLNAIPKKWPIYLQSFRIFVELLILQTFLAGVLPESASFEGYNFDILMGISAPFIGYFIYGNLEKYRTVAKLWNVLGIFMVLFVFVIVATSTYLPHLWGSDVSLVDLKFVEMPYLMLAGFLAPLAIFMHIFSLMQLAKK